MLTADEILKQMEQGNIVISDFAKERLGANSYNLRLANEIAIYRTPENGVLDLKTIADTPIDVVEIPESGFMLQPNTLYLARTMEHTETHAHIPQIDGRSSIGRAGIFVHVTAGFGDIGFRGFWTLEIFCVQPIVIYPAIEICQIYYHNPDGFIKKRYEGNYQANKGIQGSKFKMKV
jgi:dCTP deaminase